MREFIIRNKQVELDRYSTRNRLIYHREIGDYYFYNRSRNLFASRNNSIALKIKRTL